MHQFLVVIEKTKNNDSVNSPDLSGWAATGKTAKSASSNMHKAIQMYVGALLVKEKSLPLME